MEYINILGIDPSFRNTGLAVCQVDINNKEIKDIISLKLSCTENNKNKKTSKSSDDLKRARQHYLSIKEIIAAYRIKIVVAEIPSGAQSARAAMSNGICLGLLACLDIPLVQVTPAQVKMASVNYKHADKVDIIQWAYARFPNAQWIKSNRKNKNAVTTETDEYLTPPNEHLADAIASVQAGLITEQLYEQLKIEMNL
jgi:Holliday junction resolvasome RuvABC endonuclease subunit